MKKYSTPTHYKGTLFRSRLEAAFVKWFDAMGLAWSYEPEGYKLENGQSYLPDFYLPSQKAWFECKGVMLPEDESKIVQLATESGLDVFVGMKIRGGQLQVGVVDMFNEGPAVDFRTPVIAAKCKRCAGIWLMSDWGSWACRCCGHYDGNAGFETLAICDPAIQNTAQIGDVGA